MTIFFVVLKAADGKIGTPCAGIKKNNQKPIEGYVNQACFEAVHTLLYLPEWRRRGGGFHIS